VFVKRFRVSEWDGDDPGDMFLRVVPLAVVESNVGPRVAASRGAADGVVHGLGAVLEFVLDVRVCVVDPEKDGVMVNSVMSNA